RPRNGIGSNNADSARGGPVILMRRFLVVAALSSCFVIWSISAKATVQVEYVHPENFTDVSFRSTTPEAAEKRLERELTHTIEAAAAQYLSAYQLDVQI